MKKLTLGLTSSSGRNIFAWSLHSVWFWVLGILLAGTLTAGVRATATYLQTIRTLKDYAALTVEVEDLRRQNEKLLELEAELRDLLEFQQTMLRLAGIETALRSGEEAGDNYPELGGDSTGLDVQLIWPVMGEDIRGFGPRHSGVDIGLPQKRGVMAAGSGKVVDIGRDEVLGYHLTIEHNDSVRTVYGNNDMNLVAMGDSVEAGQTIALVGAGFEGPEPHLHFEVRINNTPVRPQDWILSSFAN